MIPLLSLQQRQDKNKGRRTLFFYGIGFLGMGFALGTMAAFHPWLAAAGYVLVGIILAKFFRPWL